MSVKISRREEKRNTSLRDFILASMLPLLLTGLIGFFIGKAEGIDAGVSNAELQDLSEQLKAANKKLLEFDTYAASMDSLRLVLNKSIKDFDESFYQEIQQETNAFDLIGGPLQRWGEKLSAAQQSLNDDLSEIYGPGLGREILSEEQLDALTDPLRSLILEKFKALQTRRSNYKFKNSNEEELRLALTKQEEAGQEKTEKAGRELELVKQKLESSQIYLERCEKDLARAQANEPPLPPTFAAEKQVIKAAVSDIRRVIPELPKGIFGNKKDVREEIITAVESIDAAAERIK